MGNGDDLIPGQQLPRRAHSMMHDVNDALSLVTGHLTLLAESSGLDRDQRESVLTALEASNEAAERLRELKRICAKLFPSPDA
jgi:hypothetical protein